MSSDVKCGEFTIGDFFATQNNNPCFAHMQYEPPITWQKDGLREWVEAITSSQIRVIPAARQTGRTAALCVLTCRLIKGTGIPAVCYVTTHERGMLVAFRAIYEAVKLDVQRDAPHGRYTL